MQARVRVETVTRSDGEEAVCRRTGITKATIYTRPAMTMLERLATTRRIVTVIVGAVTNIMIAIHAVEVVRILCERMMIQMSGTLTMKKLRSIRLDPRRGCNKAIRVLPTPL